ncbi:MAG: hypothetical protein K8U03_25025 [Planctomycetia bacterium]|nr:hypothetical protein [Planctomycetia bacterium]
MANIDDLVARIDSEFSASEQRVKHLQNEALAAYEGRQERFKTFLKTCERLQDVWRPRLETLAKKFGDEVKVSPSVVRGERHVTLDFKSPLAAVKLAFSASTDPDVRKLVLQYDLEILPILMEFPRHAQFEAPLDNIDAASVGKWIDDRIVDFVKSYLAMQHNQYYLKDHMVTDPISGTSLPKFAAAATHLQDGVTYHFISEKTRDEFVARGGKK